MHSETDSLAEEFAEHDGSAYVAYLKWKFFWGHRCDSATGRPHNFGADFLAELNQQNKTTSSYYNCGRTSPLQSSLTSGPSGWQFIGPRNITIPSGCSWGDGNSENMRLGQVNDIAVNASNPSEIYFIDNWGGLWKTSNAYLAPANTWTCLSDNLPEMSGVGVTDMYIDFAYTPHRIICVLGTPFAYALPNTTEQDPHTVGIYYSLDGGTSFSRMDISAAISDLGSNPILAFEYWTGNSSSIEKFAFLASKYKIFRLNITDPSHVTCTTVVDVTNKIIDDDRPNRFKGFTDIGFNASTSSIMYASTKSNIGYAHSNTAEVLRMPNCTSCTTCVYSMIPGETSEILQGTGHFTDNASGWMFSVGLGTWEYNNPSGYLVCPSPPTSGYYSCEHPVPGSYLQNISYQISFSLTLPPRTKVEVKLKNVHSVNAYIADFGTSTPSLPSGSIAGGNYDVGYGEEYPSGTPISGAYINSSYTTTHTFNITTTVNATAYVNRLQFGAQQLSGYSSGDITLDNVEINTPNYDKLSNIKSTGALLAVATERYKISELLTDIKRIRLVTDDGSTYPSASITNPSTTNRFELSPYLTGTLYSYPTQSHGIPRVEMVQPSVTPSVTPSSTSTSQLHPDTRSVFVLPAPGGEDSLYLGTDGGIAKGTITGNWKNLNGTNLATSWAFDVGSSIFTGEVGLAATDNGCMWAPVNDRLHWSANIDGDGGQLKYGKRSITKNVRFEGYSGGSGFDDLNMRKLGGEPEVDPLSLYVKALPMCKMVATFNAEYVSSLVTIDNVLHSNVHRIDVVSGTGATLDPYIIAYTSLTEHASFSKGERIQSIAPDLYEPKYMAVYKHNYAWDHGKFSYCNDITASTPVWTEVSNSSANVPAGTNHTGLLCLVADPRSPRLKKRLWAGGAGYGTAGINRVFEAIDDDAGDLINMKWKDISIGLPAGPVNVLAYDEQSHYLFAGTDRGVYAFNVDNGTNSALNPWVCYSLHLPNMFVTGLDINRCTGKIYASSYGRGVYEAELPPALNVNASSTAFGSTGPTDNCDVNYIASNTTWYQDRTEIRSVYVPSNVELKIIGCTITMGRDRNIIVAPGGKLTVENATLKNECGYFWGGIQAWGQTFQPQHTTDQAQVSLRTGTVIENAMVGIRNYNPDPTVVNMSGGMIQAYKCTFRNNVTDAVFHAYTNFASTYPFPEIPDVSTFTNCKFIINDNYYGMRYALYPKHRVMLEMVKGVKFLGCHFENACTTTHRGYGDGIYAVDAGFNAHVACTSMTLPCSSFIPCKFEGFTRGICVKQATAANIGAVSVDQAEFNNVSIGVNVVAHSAVSVTRSKFYIGGGRIIPTVPAEPGIPLGCGKNIGIFTQNAPSFKIEDNTFNGVSNTFGHTPWYNIGVYVANSGNTTKRIMLNRFNTLSFGVIGVGDNSVNHYPAPSGYGLQISCNNFSSNTNDIRSGGLYDWEGIGKTQFGPGGGDAGNIFSGSSTNIHDANPTYNIFYHKHYSPSISKVGPVTFINEAYTNTCKPTIKTNTSGGAIRGDFLIAPTTALNIDDMNEIKSNFYKAKNDFITNQQSYISLLDYGNTESLVELIDSTTNRTNLYDTLNKISPWLSINALATAVVNAEQGEYTNVIALLAANPDVIRDKEILDIIADYMAMDSTDYQMLIDTMTAKTDRSIVETAITVNKAEMDENVSAVLMALKSPIDTDVSVYDTLYAGVTADTESIYYLVDTSAVYASNDSLEFWLSNTDGLHAIYERIGMKFNQLKFQDAVNLFNSIDTTLLDSVRLEEYHTYSVLGTVLANVYQDGRNIHELNQQELEILDSELKRTDAKGSLFDGMEKMTANTAKKLIWGIRNLDIHVPCASAPPSSKPSISKHKIWKYAINNIKKIAPGYTKAYPNPSSGNVTFEYRLPESLVLTAMSINLTVTNAMGERVLQTVLPPGISGKYIWESSSVASGLYVYQFTTEKELIGSGKVTLIK